MTFPFLAIASQAVTLPSLRLDAAWLTGYLNFGNLEMFYQNCLAKFFIPRLVTLSVHELVIIDFIFHTERPKILGLAASLIEGITT